MTFKNSAFSLYTKVFWVDTENGVPMSYVDKYKSPITFLDIWKGPLLA